MRALATLMVLETTPVALETEEDLDQEGNTVIGGIPASEGLGVPCCSIS